MRNFSRKQIKRQQYKQIRPYFSAQADRTPVRRIKQPLNFTLICETVARNTRQKQSHPK